MALWTVEARLAEAFYVRLLSGHGSSDATSCLLNVLWFYLSPDTSLFNTLLLTVCEHKWVKLEKSTIKYIQWYSCFFRYYNTAGHFYGVIYNIVEHGNNTVLLLSNIYCFCGHWFYLQTLSSLSPFLWINHRTIYVKFSQHSLPDFQTIILKRTLISGKNELSVKLFI